MLKIVITGGPSAGKTSLIDALKTKYSSHSEYFFAPEVASMLLGNGFPRCEETEDLIFQQRAIFQTQTQMEELIAKEKKYKACFFDRGLLDALAYVKNPHKVCESPSDFLERYDHIFHLEVAPLNSYNLSNNKARTESHTEAVRLENSLRELWGSHSSYQFVPSQETFDEKLELLCEKHLSKILG